MVIWETPSDPRPTELVIASSFAPLSPNWQSVFMLGDCPLPTDSCIQNWASGQGGWIVDSLGQTLLLPDDMQYFVEGSDEAISLKLKWHTIATSQMTHMLEGQLNGAVEEAEKERALKEVSEALCRTKL
ncbi:uncharacterized protein LOC115974227 [Quercus lobata]|uniref:uncharacterized protein LOC115974227 n=1 Tax=Quercus lobata TaxID=97700 RepID=UPI00124825F8|nr:uncharacterized protein LOC115974227 [Quercus lobata]